MLALANVMHLFANKLTCLGAGRFTLSGILAGAFNSLLFRHIRLLKAKRSTPSSWKESNVLCSSMEGSP